MIDLHSHILPGVDDGARSLADSFEIGRRASAEGVIAIAATPHVRADYPTTPQRIEDGVAALRTEFAAEGLPLELVHGAEIDLGLLWELADDDLIRLSLGQGGRYLLLEFPYRGWPLALEHACARVRALGATPILAHPERNPAVQDRPDQLESVVRNGALVQVTAASLDGRLAPAAKSAAGKLLERRLVHLLATDAHGPHIRDAGLEAAARGLGDEGLARYLTSEAPAAVLAGDAVPPPPRWLAPFSRGRMRFRRRPVA